MIKTYPTEVVQPLGKHNKPYPCIHTKHVQQYIDLPYDYLNPLQSKFLPYLESDDTNVVVSAETSSGKTLVAELFAARAISLGKKVLYVAPMKALADEKYEEWISEDHTFSRYKVEILTGDFELTDAKKKKLHDSDIILVTPEMLNAKCRQFDSHSWIDDSCLICDESHLLGLTGRGDSLEVGIMQYYENCQNARSLFLSATLPNIEDIKVWIEHLSGRETVIIKSKYRPCTLNRKFIKFNTANRTGRTSSYKGIEELRLKETIRVLLDRCIPEPTLIFTGSKIYGKRLCEELVALDIPHAFHNADLSRKQRKKIESDFREGRNNVLIATTSVAWGINSPARYVVQCHTNFGLSPMHPSNILQAIGRAGRAGWSDRGDAFILIPDKPRENYFQKEKSRISENYLIESTLNERTLLIFHVLSYVVSGEIKTETDVERWYSKTLAYVQDDHLQHDMPQKVLKHLQLRGMIRKDKNDEYIATVMGRITAKMYMNPLNVYDWMQNFQNLHQIETDNPDFAKKVNFRVANALASCYDYGATWQVGGDSPSLIKSPDSYITNMEKETPEVIDIVNMFRIDADKIPHIKYIAAFNLILNGKADEISPPLNSLKTNIMKDSERIISTLKQIDNQIGYKKKAKGNCVGLGWGDKWDTLALKLKYGVGSELLNLINIEGIGKTFAKKLYEHGITNEQQLLDRTNEVRCVDILKPKRYRDIVNRLTGREVEIVKKFHPKGIGSKKRKKLEAIGIKTKEEFIKPENKKRCIDLVGEKTYIKAFEDINGA
jgi:replicative superfamily II helicase